MERAVAAKRAAGLCQPQTFDLSSLRHGRWQDLQTGRIAALLDQATALVQDAARE